MAFSSSAPASRVAQIVAEATLVRGESKQKHMAIYEDIVKVTSLGDAPHAAMSVGSNLHADEVPAGEFW
eukprot:4001569-Amphidinium_carterae.1